MKSRKRTILVAGMGTSPAVLTETVWALAMRTPPIVPDEICVLTTTTGKQAIEKHLFESGGWKRLQQALAKSGVPVEGRLRFGLGGEFIRIPSTADGSAELADITSDEDNSLVADFFLSTLRQFTEDPSTVLYTSIAGGRKTMGALLLSCMSLLGRNEDHVLHVLVNPPFDGNVDPHFLFPERGVRYTPRGGGRPLSFKDASLSLVDIPFVKMRGWYQDKFKSPSPRYSDLVRAAQAAGPEASVQKPLLRFDLEDGSLFVDGDCVRLSPVEFVTLATDILLAPGDLASALVAIHGRSGGDFGWLGDFASGYAGGNKFERMSSAKEDLTRARSSLRVKLRSVPVLTPFVDMLVPRGQKHGSWPESRISADVPKFKKMVGMG